MPKIQRHCNELRITTQRLIGQRLLVGCETGEIINFSPGSEIQFPSHFKPSEPGLACINPVHCIKPSPFVQDLFLVGYGSGKIALFTVQKQKPIMYWHLDTMTSLDWSRHRPGVFFVHSQGSLYIWDLCKNNAQYDAVFRQDSVIEQVSFDQPMDAIEPSVFIVFADSTMKQFTLSNTYGPPEMDEMQEFLDAIQ